MTAVNPPQPTAQDAADPVVQEDAGPRYEDAPFGVFIRFGGGRGGMWFRYKGHVRSFHVRYL